jgi:hypothetical protein
MISLSRTYNDKPAFDKLKAKHGLTDTPDDVAFKILDGGMKAAYQDASRIATAIRANKEKNAMETAAAVDNNINGILAKIINGKSTPTEGLAELDKVNIGGTKYPGTAALKVAQVKQGIQQVITEAKSASNLSYAQRMITSGQTVDAYDMYSRGMINESHFNDLKTFQNDTKAKRESSKVLSYINQMDSKQILKIGDEIYDNAMDILKKNPEEGAMNAFGKARTEALKYAPLDETKLSRGAKKQAGALPIEKRIEIARMLNGVKDGKITEEMMIEYIDSMTPPKKKEEGVVPDKSVNMAEFNNLLGTPNAED